MTALNVWCDRNGAYIVSDTAAYVAGAKVVDFRSKVASSPRLSIAIGRNGHAKRGTGEYIANWLEGFETQAAALDALPQLVELLQANVTPAPADLAGDGRYIPDHATYFIAAWLLDQAAPAAFFIASGRTVTLPAGCEPLSTYELTAGASMLSPSVPFSAHPKRRQDVRTEAMALIEAQRLAPDDIGAFTVGGRGELTIVDAAGVRTEELCSWSDRVGEKIDPRRVRRPMLSAIGAAARDALWPWGN